MFDSKPEFHSDERKKKYNLTTNERSKKTHNLKLMTTLFVIQFMGIQFQFHFRFRRKWILSQNKKINQQTSHCEIETYENKSNWEWEFKVRQQNETVEFFFNFILCYTGWCNIALLNLTNYFSSNYKF